MITELDRMGDLGGNFGLPSVLLYEEQHQKGEGIE
jgi:hypothetical protein